MAEVRFHPTGLAIEVRGLRVTLGGTPVLRGVDLHVARGQIVALIGPNGSGKTTLLRCLLGLQPPSHGEMRIFGQRIGPEVLRRVGYVPQRLALDRSFVLSVREFLSLRLRETQGWFWQRRQTTDSALHAALPEFDLDPLMDRPVAGLSGGQLQRVLIAFSLLAKPELLLLDEPTAGVDTPGENTFYELIAGIHQRHQLTVVLVSHDLSMVYRHAARVFALNGVICCEGTPEEVMNADSLKQAYGIHVTPYHHDHGPGHHHWVNIKP
ncbi:MAG TPA: metal ABC transporter ATP-binding protein [Verrucomicrobiota bacterium]|nr:zinc ABC transporter ATP-binding protein ZnuC [Verrucomicrobiales bacterium]HRI15138.1 metal ABC transporter ATP-binding protein [Verrucomicrobiota bacterium]